MSEEVREHESGQVRRISAREFREVGFLQEVNRQFFHPLGLALEVLVYEDGTEKFGGVWDYRDDPEGMLYADGTIDPEKSARVESLRQQKAESRRTLLGYEVQPVPHGDGS